MTLEFSRQIFEKYSNIKFHENPSSGSWVVPCRRMHRHDEANSCTLCSLNFAKSLKICHTNIIASHVQFIRLETKIRAAQLVDQIPISTGTAEQPNSCNLTICHHWQKHCKTIHITFTKRLKAQRTRKLKDTLISFYYSCIHVVTYVIFTDHPALTDRKTSSISHKCQVRKKWPT